MYVTLHVCRRAGERTLKVSVVFTRDSIYAIARICHANSVRPSVRPSVRLSHACIVSKRLNASSKFFHCKYRRIILVFRHQGRCVNLTASPQWGRQIQGGSNFRPICDYISERVLDRGIVTMEDENVLYRIVPLSMTLNDPEPQFQGHSIV